MREANPVLLGNDGYQVTLDLNRITMFRESKEARKTDDMCVDRNPLRVSVELAQDDVGGLAADAGQRLHGGQIVRHDATMQRHHLLRRRVQVAAAGVITEAGPQRQHLVEIGRRERGEVRKAGHEALEVRDDGRDLRLLEHDF